MSDMKIVVVPRRRTSPATIGLLAALGHHVLPIDLDPPIRPATPRRLAPVEAAKIESAEQKRERRRLRRLRALEGQP